MGSAPPLIRGAFYTFFSQLPGRAHTASGVNNFSIQFLSFIMPLAAI